MGKLRSKVTCSIRKIFKAISDEFHDFCDSTVLHGFRYIGDRSMSIWERLFFLASLIVILVYVSTLISDIYAKWYRTPVIVGFSPKPILINRLPFPTVTICNVNQASLKKVQNFSRDSEEYSMLQTVCSRSLDNMNPSQMADIKNRTVFQAFIREIAQPCENLFISCRFGTILKDCKDIFQPVLSDEGQCCVFNGLHSSFIHRHKSRFDNTIQLDGSVAVDWEPETGYQKPLPKFFYPRVASGTGISKGLTVILNADADDYYCSSTNGVGFKLLLHNPIEMPSLRENGLFTRVGSEMMFRIDADRSEASDIHDFSIHDRQCVFQSERKLAYFKTYTRRNCEMECQANMSASLCGCISYFLPKTGRNLSACTLKDVPCVRPILFKTAESAGKTTLIDCNDLCMQGCFDLSFSPTRFAIPLTSGGYMLKNRQLEKYNSTYLKQNIAVVHFYYKLSNFNGFMRTRYVGGTEFLSNTGGLIGLLGFSVISVAEVLYYVFLRPLRPFINWISASLTKMRNGRKDLEQRQPTYQDTTRNFRADGNSRTRILSKTYRNKVENRISYPIRKRRI